MNTDNQINILGVHITNTTVDKAIADINRLLCLPQKSIIFFVNFECLRLAQSDNDYKNRIGLAKLVLSDGIGLSITARLFGHVLRENCNGTDFSPRVMKIAAENGYRVFFLGGEAGIAEKAADRMKRAFPSLVVAGYHQGFFSDDRPIIDAINLSRTDILFVGRGTPLQEKWIVDNLDTMEVKMCFGVGALMEYLSGYKSRAPLIMRRCHLEWLWRIILNPLKYFKRYCINGISFMLFVFSHALFGKVCDTPRDTDKPMEKNHGR